MRMSSPTARRAVHPGQVLTIPGVVATAGPSSVQTPQRLHIVEPGEMLSDIADRSGVDVHGIVDANGLASANVIYPGQELVIPSTSRAPVAWVDYDGALTAAANEFGIRPSLLKALAMMESGWQMDVVSYVGAVGLMQIMPSTAEWASTFLVYGAQDWETDVNANARMGAAILLHWLQMGDWTSSWPSPRTTRAGTACTPSGCTKTPRTT